jgi:hypothetical protein
MSAADSYGAKEEWFSVKDRLPATGVMVYVRQDQWAPVTAYLDERNEWKFIEYQHPHHVTHWRHK